MHRESSQAVTAQDPATAPSTVSHSPYPRTRPHFGPDQAGPRMVRADSRHRSVRASYVQSLKLEACDPELSGSQHML